MALSILGCHTVQRYKAKMFLSLKTIINFLTKGRLDMLRPVKMYNYDLPDLPVT